MIIWTIKLLSNVRKAVAGRQYPSQLAWAVAFGVLLGIVPHGNLLALVILICVLSLKINHAMAMLATVTTTFAAAMLDPLSHRLGEFVLMHPEIQPAAATAWQWPLVPWTDLNNTIVMGSFLIGIATLVPLFLISYPIFRWLASVGGLSPDPQPADAHAAVSAGDPSHQVVMIEPGHHRIAPPHQLPDDPAAGVAAALPAIASQTASQNTDSADADQTLREFPCDEAEAKNAVEQIAVETRIDVIRIQDFRNVDESRATASEDSSEEQEPIDEALSYLLCQLRDSQQRNAA